ncbi:large conductance mechanosensitive channel protein MscL [Sphingomicrobium astaxanthinifaciens]|uniref:large conductance mechanosensitive channel protein MscL n=1 Tax=Sphingomicrobium astaxanthinifaciens TaxID=1227949 RepID=UPI001FCB4B30|nr:large conductance mechanosensitive channel protein MscL [Sphingomicrobium astaxanthinifaciens]MCJ7421889.1 large conductance mechanosensitive channel protein MscL [Sphingomicrobium astaxanthinifaciens]
MFADFKKFIAKGNVIDLAVAVIIGGAFALITKALTDDIIMPLVGVVFGGLDFSNYFTLLGPVPEGYEGSLTNYSELKEAGAAVLGWGAFLTTVLNFLILGFIIFLLVRWVKKVIEAIEREEEAAPAAPKGPTEVELLQDIRDELKKRPVA